VCPAADRKNGFSSLIVIYGHYYCNDLWGGSVVKRDDFAELRFWGAICGECGKNSHEESQNAFSHHQEAVQLPDFLPNPLHIPI